MALKDVLKKLTNEDKKTLLTEVVILPMIEDDKSLSQEEYGDAMTAGTKLGFSKEEIDAEIQALVKQVGAVIEQD